MEREKKQRRNNWAMLDWIIVWVLKRFVTAIKKARTALALFTFNKHKVVIALTNLTLLSQCRRR